MGRGKKICIVSDLHISTNPRVWKEADALARAGYDVAIVTAHNSAISKQKDESILARIHESVKYMPVYSTIPDEISLIKKLFFKFRTAFAVGLKKFGVDTIYLIAKSPNSVLAKALNVNADLYLCHVDCPLYLGKHLINAGKNVAYDFEDWYSKDYINSRRPVSMLADLESFALNKAKFVLCPSNAMAEALQNEYNSSLMPDVVYNSFPLTDEEKESIKYDCINKPTLVWFSQTIGAGRGLEKIIDSLSNVEMPIRLLLVGDIKPEYKSTLEEMFPFSHGHVLEIIPPVPHSELHALLYSCDIGLALEDKFPESRNKTVTNKILQYLQAGLKVLATDTDGQKEIADNMTDCISLVNATDNIVWGDAITRLLNNDINKEQVAEEYNKYYSWDLQESKLLKLVRNAITS